MQRVKAYEAQVRKIHLSSKVKRPNHFSTVNTKISVLQICLLKITVVETRASKMSRAGRYDEKIL